MCFAVYIQACRALMIIALILGLLSVILGTMGLKCTKLGSTSEETKGKISLTAGVIFILSGQCDDTHTLSESYKWHFAAFMFTSACSLCQVCVLWWQFRGTPLKSFKNLMILFTEAQSESKWKIFMIIWKMYFILKLYSLFWALRT